MRRTTCRISRSIRTCTSKRSKRLPATYVPGGVRVDRLEPHWSRNTSGGRASRMTPERRCDMSWPTNRRLVTVPLEDVTYRDTDPAALSGHDQHPPRVGFFTDTSVCIGCKACEVACKEWNNVPEDGLNLTGMSYDNTGGLGADTWRHVAFIEQRKPVAMQIAGAAPPGLDLQPELPEGSGTPPDAAPMTPTTPGPL